MVKPDLGEAVLKVCGVGTARPQGRVRLLLDRVNSSEHGNHSLVVPARRCSQLPGLGQVHRRLMIMGGAESP